MFHLVDDSFVTLKAFYPLVISSATRFFIFFDGESGKSLGMNYKSVFVGFKAEVASIYNFQVYVRIPKSLLSYETTQLFGMVFG